MSEDIRIKNSSNNMSRLDLGTVARDAHNDKEHATDTVVVNSFSPARYSKTEYIMKDMGDGTQEVEFVVFYGLGNREVSKVVVDRGFPLGKGEITTVFLTYKESKDLDGKFFIVYDDSGSVGILFRIDTSPIIETPTNRQIVIDLDLNDTDAAIAEKLKIEIDADSEFSAARAGSICLIQSVTIGNKTNSDKGTSNLIVTSQDGLDSLNSKYFFLYDENDQKYHIWMNVDSTGVDPSPASSIGIETILLSNDTKELISEKIVTAINLSGVFKAQIAEDSIIIENIKYGETEDIADVNTNYRVEVQNKGKDVEIISKVQVLFDSNNFITGIERII